MGYWVFSFQNYCYFCPPDGILCVYPIWWKKVAIFFLFELRTPSTPSIGIHPSMLAPRYWLNFFISFHNVSLSFCGSQWWASITCLGASNEEFRSHVLKISNPIIPHFEVISTYFVIQIVIWCSTKLPWYTEIRQAAVLKFIIASK